MTPVTFESGNEIILVQKEQNKKFSKEKGFSEITADWGKKYSDDIILLIDG